jgi:sulfate permease, SulP family
MHVRFNTGSLAAAPVTSRLPRLTEVLRTEVLGCLVVALALIPEAISFSIIAGVDPAVGLFASFTMAVVISVVGGRKAMISAATGAVALVIAPLNREHGLGYLVAAVVLAGVFQVVLGALGVAKLMRFVPRSVMVGFGDASSVAALDAIETKYASRGKKVTITGLNDPSARMHDRLAGELVGGH